ncbi:hypothetical protein N9M74_02145 [Pontimonas sp.]|nr:hypothetical protein [Pontimonas sp.]
MGLWKKVGDRLLGYKSSREFAVLKNSNLFLTHDSGFFSNCSVLIKSLAQSPVHPVTIDATASFTHFTNQGRPFDWYRFFRPAPSKINTVSHSWQSSRVASRLPHHSVYRLLDYASSNGLVRDYFSLSEEVQRKAEDIKSHKLPAPLDRIVVLCVRGTDKKTEVRQSSLDSYVRAAKKALAHREDVAVWVQTDQAQTRDYLLEQIGTRAFSVDTLPVTDDSIVIHRTDLVHDKDDFALNLLATTWLMSQASMVITYTGNVGYWIALFRGNSRGLIQLR